MPDPDFPQLNRFPTAMRPLIGLTILAVEDSRFASEALRQMCLRSGARLRRADCLTSADRHLSIYRPSVAIIDIGLPDGDGLQLIKMLQTRSPRIDVILGTSGDDALETDVIAAGADGFLPKPIANLASFQELILAALPNARRPLGPRAINNEDIKPSDLSFLEDLSHAADLIKTAQAERDVDYATQFVAGVARCAQDTPLKEAADALAIARMQNADIKRPIHRLQTLLGERLSSQSPLQRRI